MQRTLIWQRLDQPGTEFFTLRDSAEEKQLRGTVVLALEDVPVQVRYAVNCDDQWQTRTVDVVMIQGNEQETLRLRVDNGTWVANDVELPDVRDCVDVDLAVTPATNTLPIRRFNLDVGKSCHMTAAWLQFPSLQIASLTQKYIRLSETRYVYESGSGDNMFRADLEVDDLGLVTVYSDMWVVVAGSGASSP